LGNTIFCPDLCVFAPLRAALPGLSHLVGEPLRTRLSHRISSWYSWYSWFLPGLYHMLHVWLLLPIFHAMNKHLPYAQHLRNLLLSEFVL
jgi:hypothetical protein